MNYIDQVNCLFYSAGAFFGWSSVISIYKAKNLVGYNFHTQGLYFAWGIWNVYMYSHLTFWLTMVADIAGTVASVTYFVLALKYKHKGLQKS